MGWSKVDLASSSIQTGILSKPSHLLFFSSLKHIVIVIVIVWLPLCDDSIIAVN